MSSAVRSYHASLYGLDERSDCVVRFVLSRDEADRLAKCRRTSSGRIGEDGSAVGSPFPGHTFMLCPGSSFFNSQAERWASDQPAGTKLELRVPLGSVDDPPHALAAIRFIYTDKLDVSGAADLLNVRRLASFLGVEGCVEAADEDPGAAELLEELYKHSWEQLVAFQGPSTAIYTAQGDRTALGELLAWALRDAPSVLNNPPAKAQALSLSASALEALLSSDAFATDDEASVLLLLAEWLAANPLTTPDIRAKLCRHIRLTHMSSVYLFGVLPRLQRWFELTAHELSLVHQCAALPAGPERERFHRESGTILGKPAPAAWFCAPARPRARSDEGRRYEWTVSREALEAMIRTAQEARPLAAAAPPPPEYERTTGRFVHGGRGIVAKGFEFFPFLSLRHRSDAAGLHLACLLPSSLQVDLPGVQGFADPGPCRLTVWGQAADGSRRAAFEMVLRDGQRVGVNRSYRQALPLAALPRATAGLPGLAALGPVARWAAYLQGGQLSGSLEWTAPEGA
ncbi:hypothetical protein HYH03_004500 [Edaphochlamys debaryana]|uniref:BACK domain-containing protein n=1 Tax=Edaphochlamys debaryana TaxID=47281 RepID=A0A835Y900_9CHLO|nr:hypothetical protein HYH03_004500 [Edaphochlamys debaryana]|eukprot:KAG2497339.1 hypothetical protein HYH03_004500 [Edaphochlamys debaryana]